MWRAAASRRDGRSVLCHAMPCSSVPQAVLAGLRAELAELQGKHKQFAAVFAQLEDCQTSNEMKNEKIAKIAEIAASIEKLDQQSQYFLEKND